MLRRLAPAVLLAALALLPATATAQVTPFLVIGDASVFEGNTGTRFLSFPVTLSPTSTAPVTAQLSAIPLTGAGFNAATGGTACTANVDFRRLDLVPFNIPAGATGTTIDVEICGDSTVEPDQHIFVSLTSVVGAQCLEGTCSAVGVIRNDDGLPTISIDNISVSELLSGSRTASFTVSLSHPTPVNTFVNFATRNGTARGAASCAPFITGGLPDYVSKSGTLTIPANSLSATIGITICGDSLTEPNETFFVDLTSPSPAGVTIADNLGQATIRNAGFVGAFDLTPDGAQVRPGELLIYTIVWTVPPGQVWRDLNTIDVRFRHGNAGLWIRWDEEVNTFSLCETVHGGGRGGRGKNGRGPSCGEGAAPGSSEVLETSAAQLHLLHSSAVGSGPTGPSVTLTLGIVFTNKAGGHSFDVELAASDDFGEEEDLRTAASVRVTR